MMTIRKQLIIITALTLFIIVLSGCSVRKDTPSDSSGLVTDGGMNMEDQATFEIKTSVATLHYPEKWQEKVNIDLSDVSAKFSCGEYKLFDLYFEGEEGFLLGTYQENPIRFVSYDIDPSDISEELFDQLCEMQEDVNVILQHLAKDTKFTMANG